MVGQNVKRKLILGNSNSLFLSVNRIIMLSWGQDNGTHMTF